MASYGRDTDDDGLNGLDNRPWWGAKWEKLSVLCFTFVIASKRSVAKGFDRSWAYFLARFWGFEGYEHGPRTNTRWMTSPHWLFENLDCSREFLRLRLPLGWQERNLMLQGRRDWRHETKSTGLSKRSLWGKGRLIKEFPHFVVRIMALCGNFRIGLLTPLLISQIWGFDNSLFWKCNTFQSWCNVYACAVWCSWCALEWLCYLYDGLVIPKTIIGREGFWIASRLLTTKIPSALLVAVGWLQHTRYPRFRSGTFGYGITTSPSR
jgi:hypothetical protein